MASQERDSSRLLTHTGENIQSESTDNSGSHPTIFILRCCLMAFLTSMLLGLEIGVLNDTINTIRKDNKTSEQHVAFMTVILHIVGLFGSLLTGLTSDRIGRRSTMFFVGVLFFAAPFLMSFSSNNFCLLMGRSVAHVGVGFTLANAPAYVAEISPANSRGRFTSLPEVFLNVGIIIGHACNYFFSKTRFNGWRLMLCQGTISLLLLTFAIDAMPESPRWLVMRGRLAEAHSVLTKTYDSKREAELRFGDIKEAAGIRRDCNQAIVAVESTEMSVWGDLLCHPTQPVHHMLVLACLIQFFRQACGTDTVILYVPQILEKAGIASDMGKLFWTIGVELVKMTFAILATCLLDKLGRRRLLLISIAGMAGWLLSLGICLKIIDQGADEHKWAARGCIGSLLCFVASSSIGLAPITSVYTSELFPLRLRAWGCAMAFAVNQWTSAVMAVVSYLLQNTISLGWTIILYAMVAFGAWVVFFKIIRMPETQRLTLEEMGQVFGELYQWRSVANETERGSSAMRQTEMTSTTEELM